MKINNKRFALFYFLLPLWMLLAVVMTASQVIADEGDKYVFKPGHPSLLPWLLADKPPVPEHNYPTNERIELGKKLFFDPRVSRDRNMSCATCHSPLFGWSDGLPTARGSKSMVLGRASPVITNTAFNEIQMWDGRKRDLEDQATGPMEASVEMNTDFHSLDKLLHMKGYETLFASAYPGENINAKTAAKAIASFEWTIISNDSPFDNWVRGDTTALTEQQIRGFKLFVNKNKGNCIICHSAPNFTDNGFHNIGLKSYGKKDPDMGRYAIKPVKVLKGAFKTPTLRDISLSAPYFHDGSANTLMEVMEHYNQGGVVKNNLSLNMKQLNLSNQEMEDIVVFLQGLTTPPKPFMLPILPLE